MNRIKVTITLQLEAENPIHAGIAIAEVIRTLTPGQSIQVAKDLVKAIDIKLSEVQTSDQQAPPDEPHQDA